MRRTWWSGVAALGLLLGLLGSPLAAGAASADPELPQSPESPAATGIWMEMVVDGLPEVSGTSRSFTAVLRTTADAAAVAGVPVTLLGREHGSTTYQPLAQGTTGADGGIHVHAVLYRTTALRWRYAGSEAYAATTSDPVVMPVAARVSAHVRDSSVTRSQEVVAGGRAGPGKAGQHVSLWWGQVPMPLSNAPAPRRIANAVVGADGTYRLSRRFRVTGTKQLFVKVNHGRGTAEGYSAYLRVRVR